MDRLWLALVLAGLAAAAAACVDPGRDGTPAADATPAVTTDAESCPIGAPVPAEIELHHLTEDLARVATLPGAEVPLIQGVAGGFYMGFAVHARNVDGCRLRATVALRDPCSDELRAVVSRRLELLDDGEGWGVPATPISHALAICPGPDPARDLHGQPYEVRVEVVDDDGRRAEAAIEIVPTCSTDLCRCQCDRDYQLDSTCSQTPDHLPEASR